MLRLSGRVENRGVRVILINLVLSTGIARGHGRGQIVPANFATSRSSARMRDIIVFP